VFHRGFRVMSAASAAALTAFTLAAGSPALAGEAHTATAASPAGGQVKVMLMTGDVALLSTAPDGKQTASVIKARKTGPGAQFQDFTEGKDVYVVPQSAVPYLGSTLSPSLFDVTQLAQQEHGAMALNVQLSMRSAADRSVPGIAITHRSGLTATGHLTLASAREFGAALARQSELDHASRTHTTGLFAGLAHVATAGTVAATTHRAKPDFQMYTLTLNGIDGAGQKDTGDLVLVYNVDNLLKYANEAVFNNGQSKVSVPVGNYSAVCLFYNYVTGAVAAVTLGQFSVTSDNASVTLDARTATSKVSISTPRPATPEVTEVGVGRGDRLGQTGSDAFLGDSQTTFTVTPVTSGISAGQLYYYVYSRMYSPSTAKTPYTYDVEFPTTGAIPVNQSYAAQASNLATVNSSYPAEEANQPALDTRFGALAWQEILFGDDFNVTTPMQRTEYYTALPGLSWEGVYYSYFDSNPFELIGEFDGSWVTYQPGQVSATVWGGQPAHPRLLQNQLFLGQTYCPACLEGDTLNLLAFPYSDNDPTHRSYPDGSYSGLTESEVYSVDADGVEVGKGTGFLEKKVTLPTGTKDVSISDDETRSSSVFTLSTSTDTTWTVRTAAPEATLPQGWFCDFNGHTKCGVLPLMYADYNLPVNLLGQIAPGSATAGISIGHLVGAANVGVNRFTVQVSYNGGASWKNATVTPQGNGQYSASFTVPASAATDGFGALKVSAADAYGSTFSQTIQHAFAVAAS
jgi:hypothetical protein